MINVRIGILAYGSLIDDPGDELVEATTEVIKDGVMTPFKVEFARTSRTREGAPTLVPVDDGGAQVPASIFVLNISETEAANRLYRRETGRIGKTEIIYRPSKRTESGRVAIERLQNFHGVDVVLYTSIGANIDPLNPTRLAELAIESARKLGDERDGITYLINAKRNGIRTPLSDAYEEEIKRLTKPKSLTEALKNIWREKNESKIG